jgi:boron transporter
MATPLALEPSQDVSELRSASVSATLQSKHKLLRWIRRLGSGIINDIRARAPWYISDWTDAWNYRVIPATALIFFAKYAQYFSKTLPYSN